MRLATSWRRTMAMLESLGKQKGMFDLIFRKAQNMAIVCY